MDMVRHVIVFDAADLDAESTFWAGIFGGQLFGDESCRCVIDASGEWYVGVQLAPNHVPPEWPDGSPPQQVHLDFHVEDPRAAHEAAIGLGARLLQADDFDAEEGHQVYADPAGHPFCIGWGHPSQEEVAKYIADRMSARGLNSGQRQPARCGTTHLPPEGVSPTIAGSVASTCHQSPARGHSPRSTSPRPGIALDTHEVRIAVERRYSSETSMATLYPERGDVVALTGELEGADTS